MRSISVKKMNNLHLRIPEFRDRDNSLLSKVKKSGTNIRS